MAENPEDPDINYIDDDEEIKSDDDETIEVDTSSEKSMDDEDEMDDDDDEDDDIIDEEDYNGEEEDYNDEDNEEEVINNEININNSILEDYDSDESNDDDNEISNFKNIENNSFIHPLMNKNNLYDMKKRCEIIYNYDDNCECDIINDTNHMTNPILTKYEKARILGIRADQLNKGAYPFIEVDEHIIDGYKIAELELKEKKIPFIIQRPLPGGNCEFWKLEDLEQI
jgi:DNA-directed RNA polymerase subunit K/omega